MIKLLKWDLINFFKKYLFLILGLFVASIFSNIFLNNSVNSSLLISNSTWTGASFSGYRIQFQLIIMLFTLLYFGVLSGDNSRFLEGSVSIPSRDIILSKMILSSFTCFVFFGLSSVATDFVSAFLSQPMNHFYGGFTLTDFAKILLYSSIVCLSYIFAKSFTLTRKHPLLFTGILYFVLTRIYTLLFGLIPTVNFRLEVPFIVAFSAVLLIIGSLMYKFRFQTN